MTKLLISPEFVLAYTCLFVDMNSSGYLFLLSVCLRVSLCISTCANTLMSVCVYGSCIRYTRRLKTNEMVLEHGLYLVTQFQRKEYRK